MAKPVEAVFTSCGEVIWIKGSDAIASKADSSASNAFCFSLN